jgi:hypothetical protein
MVFCLVPDRRCLLAGRFGRDGAFRPDCADPGEKNDVAGQNPEVVRDLDRRLIAYAKEQKMSEWLKAQPDYLGAQGKTIFDPDFDIDDGGLPREKPVLPKK